MLNHLGNPSADLVRRNDWRADLARLAGCDRVSCKVSGVEAELVATPGSAANLRFAVPVFGPGLTEPSPARPAGSTQGKV